MNILYGVPGEGMGHATRSKVVIDFLLEQGHDVQIVSSSRAYTFLKSHYQNRVHEIKGFHFAYKNAGISISRTFIHNLKSAGRNLVHNFSKYLLINKSFVPDLVISDFESFSFVFAKQHRLPLISIDNMQVIDRCKLAIPIPASEKANHFIAKSIVRAKVPGADAYIITSFFDAHLTHQNTQLVPPIIRKAILQAIATQKSHVIMYQTSSSAQMVKQVLSAIPEVTFIVYGMNKDEHDGNIIYKLFSEDGFINDLASAKAVIANGGFSFLSEAVYLKKPVYTFPINNQFEQYVNAAYIEKLGFGKYAAKLELASLKLFLANLNQYQQNLASYHQDGNAVLFSKLQDQLLAIKPKHS